MDDDFNQFIEQMSVMSILEKYCEETGADIKELYEAIEKSKNEILSQLKTYVDGIALEVNDTRD